jgi:membrane protein DedA with SNARE-associated domain/rhodanese-related sulfurtransferase
MNADWHLTYVEIWLAVLLYQLCLPVPAVIALVSGGALAARGQVSLTLVILVSILGCLCGDSVWFFLGRRWGSRVVRTLCRLSSDPRGAALKARRTFSTWGMPSLIIAKFIPVMDGVAPPLAGAEGTAISSFLFFDAVGSLLWAGLYIALGYLLSDRIDLAMRSIERFGTVLVVFVGVPLLLYICWRASVLLGMMRYLRLHRMSPVMLDRLMRTKRKVAVIDLLRFEDSEECSIGIPGAARIDPERLRKTPKVSVPDDLNVVVYCSSQSQIVSARVAVSLRQHGAKNVWVLDGGLKAWQDQGFPVTTQLSTPQQLAVRLGIDLPPPRGMETPGVSASLPRIEKPTG